MIYLGLRKPEGDCMNIVFDDIKRIHEILLQISARGKVSAEEMHALRMFAKRLSGIDITNVRITVSEPTEPTHTGVFTEYADIEAKGTGVKVSADDLDVLLADIEKLTREE